MFSSYYFFNAGEFGGRSDIQQKQ